MQLAVPARDIPSSTRFLEQTSVPLQTRSVIQGKFFFHRSHKLIIRGVTYGPFPPGRDGGDYGTEERVEGDFARMAANGLNAVRLYTLPPLWLLDAASRHGLAVLVGLPWEQHIAFLESPRLMQTIEDRVRSGVQACAGHHALLGFAIGNEIPAPIARWHGRERMERFLERLYRAATDEDARALVTYVNYPGTEYLRLPFLDWVSFNVYLEARETFEAYLARLHNLAGDRPLLMAEIGLDSRRNGEIAQARLLNWQIRSAIGSGCAGAFVFAWSDLWYRGGHDIEDWDFGLVARNGQPKPSLVAVSEAFRRGLCGVAKRTPRISVVICTYNGARTLRECLNGVLALAYPDFEVIVVNDGSTDRTEEIARAFPVRLLTAENRGLSHARNAGVAASSGELVAFIDDDAYPDRDWLSYLVETFEDDGLAAAGGPNLAPVHDGFVAQCVMNAPGGPIHVLLSDREAEHIPGCNMVFRKSRLEQIGGFDPQFRVAGDDVDICWRLQEAGFKIGFSPGALVWHHRRNSIRQYWKQQFGYGRAEALLERKWPEKYNVLGHAKWAGRLYGRGLTCLLGRRSRIYHGAWGSAPFQMQVDGRDRLFSVLPALPEWYLVLGGLMVLGSLGMVWPVLLFAFPVLGLAVSASVIQAMRGAAQATRSCFTHSWRYRFKLQAVTALLHLLQPFARLCGRLRHGLHILRLRVPREFSWPVRQTRSIWRESWQLPEERLAKAADRLRRSGGAVVKGGEFDRWDLELRAGVLGGTRMLMSVEEHGSGRQLFRFRFWPRLQPEGLAVIVPLTLMAVLAGVERAWLPCALLGGLSLLLTLRLLQECACSLAALVRAITKEEGDDSVEVRDP